MIKFSYSKIKNTITPLTLFNFDFGKKIEKKLNELPSEKVLKKSIEKQKPKDYKTTLGGAKINLIEKMNGDLCAYLLIEKNKEHSSWNMVIPVIIEKNTNVMYQYSSGCFALEGSGGGLNNTRSILRYLKLHKNKGFNVSIVPKIVDNNLLNNFEYIDGGVNLNILLENSTDLILYRKNEFKWIYSQYQKLIKELHL